MQKNQIYSLRAQVRLAALAVAMASTGFAFQSGPPIYHGSEAQVESAVKQYAANSGNQELADKIENGEVDVVQGELGGTGTTGFSQPGGSHHGNGADIIVVPTPTTAEEAGVIAVHEYTHLNEDHDGMTKEWDDMTAEEKRKFWEEECEAHCEAAQAMVTFFGIYPVQRKPSCALKEKVLDDARWACHFGIYGDNAMGPPVASPCGLGFLEELPCRQ